MTFIDRIGKNTWIICLLVLMITIPGKGQDTDANGLWPPSSKTTKPWARWWWMGSAVDQHNIRNLLKDYHSKGLGGVEIAPIYGAKGFEDRYIEYLSPKWREMLQFTIHQTDSLGMGVDLTMGTGWPFGGPWVSNNEAASKLVYREYTLKEDQRLSVRLIPEDPSQSEAQLQAVLAESNRGHKIDITGYVDKNQILDWQPSDGTWKITAFFNGKTGQKVKRAAPGGVGYVLDHYSKASVNDYLKVYDSAFHQNIPGIRAVYNDSYEVYGANWTRDFLTEFQKRRGYDLKPFLNELLSEKNTDTIIRLKSDYRETLNDLLLENFTQNWTGWAHQRGKITKNQAHGSPGNLLDLYGTVDIPECETFGSTYFPIRGLRRDSSDVRNDNPDPVMLKFASSAAHVTGKNLVSNETFTWLGEHFKSSFSQMKPELEQIFIAGINHMYYHGITYSPDDAKWPGWLFYASLSLSSSNSLWPHFGDFNQYVSRCQSVLQTGKADNEMLIYWPVYDVWANQNELLNMLSVHYIDKWLHPTSFYKWSKKMMDQGFSFDFISDSQIENSNASSSEITTSSNQPSYKTLIIPACDYLPVATLENILALADNGAKIIFEKKPNDVPGLNNAVKRRQELERLWGQLSFKKVRHSDRSQNGDLRKAKWGKGEIILSPDIIQGLNAQNIKREVLADFGLKFIRRKAPQSLYYFLVNQTAKDIDTLIPFNNTSASVILMDPLSGKTGLAESQEINGTSYVKLQLKSGESIFVQFSKHLKPSIEKWKYFSNHLSTDEINGPWKLTFIEGGPNLPKSQTINELTSWHSLKDPMAEYFSGQAVYETTFSVKDTGTYILQLGAIRESAHVWVNGQNVGYSWSIPYKMDISDYIQPGINTLKIEVANLMANRIRYQDQKGISWKNYYDINFINIKSRPFNASDWEPMPSGLIGPVQLVKYNN